MKSTTENNFHPLMYLKMY